MKKVKALQITSDFILFEDNIKLYSEHQQDYCENHYLSFSDLTLADFDGLEFDFSNDNFFNRIKGYGIELIPVIGHSVKIPGYGDNNGCYTSDLSLVLSFGESKKEYDIEECQDYYK